MEQYVPRQKSNLEFMVSAVDYMIGDFIHYLDSAQILENTTVYIFPDHLKMGDSDIFNGTGERGLFLMSNAKDTCFTFKNSDTIDQIDMPKIILQGACVKHNAKFLTDYISGDKNQYIQANMKSLTTINTAGLLRIASE